MLPKIIHHIVGPRSNEVVDRCLSSWQPLNAQGYKFMVWDDASLDKFIGQYYPYVIDTFRDSRNHAEAADIGRYLIVYHYGGHYIDWDIQLLDCKSFKSLCSIHSNGYLLRDDTDGSLASECFAASKREPFLNAAISDIVELHDSGRYKDLRTLWYTGPFRFRDSLKKYGNTKQTILKIKDVFVYDYWEIKEMPERELTRPMIHYWLHSWL